MKSATGWFVSTFGAIMALAGLEHGIGEILQGNVAPAGLMIQSWPDSSFFRNLGGEPAMTIIPSLLASGILTVVVALALLVWSVGFVQRRQGGWVMMGLAVLLLLVGGGIFPPILVMIIGAVANRMHAPVSTAGMRPLSEFQRLLVSVWPFSFAICVLSWFALMPAGYLWGETYPLAVLAAMLLALGSLALTALAGFVKDR
jgi:hypothetical protein